MTSMCDPCALPHNFLKLDKQVLSAPRRTGRGRRVGTGLLHPEASDGTDSKLPDGGLALRVVAGTGRERPTGLRLLMSSWGVGAVSQRYLRSLEQGTPKAPGPP